VLIRVSFVVYLIVLTVLLLAKDPRELVGMPPTLLAVLAHLLSFLVLTVLAMAARWPVPGWLVLSCLLAYAGGTELLQGFLGWRTAEWVDFFQDLAGIGLGAAVYWLGRVLWRHVERA
jgi:VanZ family protein